MGFYMIWVRMDGQNCYGKIAILNTKNYCAIDFHDITQQVVAQTHCLILIVPLVHGGISGTS